MPARVPLHAPGLLDERGERDGWVIHEPPADPLEMRQNRNAEIAQVSARADTRAQQMRRAMDRPARQDHLVGAKFAHGSIDLCGDADATPALDNSR